jgi:type VI protein secretion system component Hcp
MDKKSRSQRNPAVKDLTPRDTQDVKGGTIADTATASLVKACTTGTHIPEVTIHLY